MGVAGRFALSSADATAGEFHAREVPEPADPAIWWLRVSRPALVLGSTQPDDIADREACAAAGVEVVRRRSGGGAVLLLPGDVTWLDVIVPRGGPGWAPDVHAPMVWLGRRLAAALDECGVHGATVHDGRLVTTRWSRLVCFDGIGPGEVLLEGRKLVGMSQRRTRAWARLQCCWYSRHDHGDLLALLAPGTGPADAGGLAPVATVPVAVSARVPAALRGALDGPPGGWTGRPRGEMGRNG